MRYLITFLSILCVSLFSTVAVAEQANVHSRPDSIASKEVNYTEDTFLSTRVINGQSTDGITQGRLDFRIEHRFDLLKSGYAEFYGLDHAFTFLALNMVLKTGSWLALIEHP